MFSKLIKANLKINVDKYAFIKPEMVILGNLVNALVIHTNLGKIKVIQQMTAPTDVTGIKNF